MYCIDQALQRSAVMLFRLSAECGNGYPVRDSEDHLKSFQGSTARQPFKLCTQGCWLDILTSQAGLPNSLTTLPTAYAGLLLTCRISGQSLAACCAICMFCDATSIIKLRALPAMYSIQARCLCKLSCRQCIWTAGHIHRKAVPF